LAKERLCVGVDIGASSIKLCQLRRQGSQLSVACFASAPLPQETIVDGALMNASRVVEALSDLMRDHKLKNRRAALAISGHQVIIKKIPLPKMTQSELEASIHWEAGQFIPFAIEDVFMDVQILGDSAQAAGQMDVILVAAKKDMVNDYVAVMVEAGLEPIICDVDAFAIENAYLASYEAPQSDVVLINIGAAKTNINVLSGGTSAFVRDISMGGHSYTEEIQRSFKVSFDEAEKLKLAAGREHKLRDTFIPEVDAAIQSVTQSLVAEIQHSLDFYSAQSPQGAPSVAYLSGGGAKMDALVQALGQQLGLTVEVVDPFRKMAPGAVSADVLQQVAPAAAVAVGLALRGIGER
jgi:type IV pilus assembly protein PilM